MGHPLLPFFLQKSMCIFESFFVMIYHTKYFKYKTKQLNFSIDHEIAMLCFCARTAMGYQWHLKECYTCQKGPRIYIILQYIEDCPWWFPYKALLFIISFFFFKCRELLSLKLICRLILKFLLGIVSYWEFQPSCTFQLFNYKSSINPGKPTRMWNQNDAKNYLIFNGCIVHIHCCRFIIFFLKVM